MQLKTHAIAFSALACLAGASHANIVTFTGTTAGGPTFNRPTEDLFGLSTIGTAVRYDAYSFSVSAAGSYTFLTTGLFDTFSLLYRGTFNPTSPRINALIANDDLVSPPLTTSGFALTLAAGTTYLLVNTGFSNSEFGSFSTTIGGPGNIVATIPEPAAYGMFALGLGVVGLARRRALAVQS